MFRKPHIKPLSDDTFGPEGEGYQTQQHQEHKEVQADKYSGKSYLEKGEDLINLHTLTTRAQEPDMNALVDKQGFEALWGDLQKNPAALLQDPNRYYVVPQRDASGFWLVSWYGGQWCRSFNPGDNDFSDRGLLVSVSAS